MRGRAALDHTRARRSRARAQPNRQLATRHAAFGVADGRSSSISCCSLLCTLHAERAAKRAAKKAVNAAKKAFHDNIESWMRRLRFNDGSGPGCGGSPGGGLGGSGGLLA